MGKRVRRRPILIVDEQEMMHRTIARLLDDRWPLIFASTIKDAKEDVSRNHPLTALISDVHMPGASGLEVVRLAIQLQPGLRALVYTAYDEADVIKEAHDLGAEYLRKPSCRCRTSSMENEA